MHFELGKYFIVTGGYCKNSGLTNKSRRGLLFLSEDGINFHIADEEELFHYQEDHPILKKKS